MTAEAGLERRVAVLEAAIEGLAYPLRSVEMPPLSEAEEQRFREEFDEALKEPVRVLPLPPPPGPVEIRQLLREHVTAVRPGETLVVRVPWTVTPHQLYEYQRVMDSAEGGEIPFRVLVVAGDELGVVQAETKTETFPLGLHWPRRTILRTWFSRRGRCVPRTPSQAIAVRNDRIYSLWRDGLSLVDIAKEVGVTPQRCGQVVAAFHPESDDEDGDRSLYRGYLWRLFDEVKVLYGAPGFKMSPNGGTAKGPDGEPAEDTNVKLQAAELELKILESLRKLDARDRPLRSHVTHELAQQQATEALAAVAAQRDAERREMDVLRRSAGVVPGEVLKELPPGQG